MYRIDLDKISETRNQYSRTILLKTKIEHFYSEIFLYHSVGKYISEVFRQSFWDIDFWRFSPSISRFANDRWDKTGLEKSHNGPRSSSASYTFTLLRDRICKRTNPRIVIRKKRLC